MKKLLIFIYGTIAYLVFLITFLYAIGFVGNILVPKTINSGVESPFWEAIVINAILLSVFAIQHSVMARPAFKEQWTRFIPKAMERSTYVFFSSFALLLLYWQWRPIKTIIWDVQNPTLATIILGVFGIGWLIVLLSTFMINHFELFGLQQIYNNLKNKSNKPIAFKANFFYGLVRHPIMLGFLIAFWATPVMTAGHLLFAVMTTLYIYVAVKFLEEKDLRKFIGPKYELYQKEVPMFIPFTKKKVKKSITNTI
ncbi:methanethiol S-methyltransferase [Geojedonia litorea]|uniref:methanethiol S-methyltransferase n=1 Tax=Geojedonia litorea TaxID=1268269 RepID=A0ABV9N4W7_9FLAO